MPSLPQFQISLPARPRHRAGTLLIALVACALGACGGRPVEQDRVTGSSLLPVAPAADLLLASEQRTADLALRATYPGRRGHYPLIVLVPAGAPAEGGYASLAAHWAACGYVVLELRYPDAPPVDPRSTPRLVLERARDPAFVLDSLGEVEKRVPALRGSIDRQHVAIVGHGSGGLVAMAAAGLRLTAPGGAAAGAADPRVAALVLIGDPGTPELVARDAWLAVPKPTFILLGSETSARTIPGTARVPPAFSLADPPSPVPHHELRVRDLDRCLGGIFCRGPGPSLPDYAALTTLQDASTAFLDAYLRHDPAGIAWLARTDRADIANGRGKLATR